MKSSWFRSQKELDERQKEFITLPLGGRHYLNGPPGSGKTNLLLLRAEFTAASGEKNVLIITYTNTLANFIRAGISAKGLIGADQVKTYHSWACQHIGRNLGKDEIPVGPFNDETRGNILERLQRANATLPSQKTYNAIFVDEAQDLSVEELKALLCLSDSICICGDANQGIYQRDGLSAVGDLNLTFHTLRAHYRIGHKIARTADRLIPPEKGKESLEDTSNYNSAILGESSAELHQCHNRDSQFEKMYEKILLELDAFGGDSIGIFCGKVETCRELYELFCNTPLKDNVVFHGVDEESSFADEKAIHILTMHSSKGTEFRSVHMYGVEELFGSPLQRTRLIYTAVTRAKTALNVYTSGSTARSLESAMAKKNLANLDDILPL